MRRYWWKIGLGAAMVFALGMTVVSIVNAGKSGFRRVTASLGTRLPLELTDLPVRLHGRMVGQVSGLRVRRDSRQEVGEVTLRVDQARGVSEADLAACDVAVRSLRRIRHTQLRCAEPAEIASGGLTRVGEVVFEPAGVHRPLYFTDRDLERWLRSGIRSLDADVVRETEGRVRATGRFDLTPDHGRPERGTFALEAGNGNARFVVRDERGRQVLHIRAGDGGISVDRSEF